LDRKQLSPLILNRIAASVEYLERRDGFIYRLLMLDEWEGLGAAFSFRGSDRGNVWSARANCQPSCARPDWVKDPYLYKPLNELSLGLRSGWLDLGRAGHI
jgi:hypothetical protein